MQGYQPRMKILINNCRIPMISEGNMFWGSNLILLSIIHTVVYALKPIWKMKGTCFRVQTIKDCTTRIAHNGSILPFLDHWTINHTWTCIHIQEQYWGNDTRTTSNLWGDKHIIMNRESKQNILFGKCFIFHVFLPNNWKISRRSDKNSNELFKVLRQKNVYVYVELRN